MQSVLLPQLRELVRAVVVVGHVIVVGQLRSEEFPPSVRVPGLPLRRSKYFFVAVLGTPLVDVVQPVVKCTTRAHLVGDLVGVWSLEQARDFEAPEAGLETSKGALDVFSDALDPLRPGQRDPCRVPSNGTLQTPAARSRARTHDRSTPGKRTIGQRTIGQPKGARKVGQRKGPRTIGRHADGPRTIGQHQ